MGKRDLAPFFPRRLTYLCAERKAPKMTAEIAPVFIRRLARFVLVSCIGVLVGCSLANKEVRLSSLERAEHRLIRAERMRSDPQQKTGEFLSVARTAADEISRAPTAADLSAEEPVRIYNRAAADLAAELPELSKGYDSSQSLTTQDRLTGEIYLIRTRPSEPGEYPFTYFQEILGARTLKPRRGEPVAAVSGVGGTLVGVHRNAPPGSPLARFEPTKGFRVPVTSVVDFSRRSKAGPIDARLRLINPLRRDSVEIDGTRFPLAANFSAPIVAFGRVSELWLGFINMIRSANPRSKFGLLFAEPYDPDRIPVIFCSRASFLDLYLAKYCSESIARSRDSSPLPVLGLLLSDWQSGFVFRLAPSGGPRVCPKAIRSEARHHTDRSQHGGYTFPDAGDQFRQNDLGCSLRPKRSGALLPASRRLARQARADLSGKPHGQAGYFCRYSAPRKQSGSRRNRCHSDLVDPAAVVFIVRLSGKNGWSPQPCQPGNKTAKRNYSDQYPGAFSKLRAFARPRPASYPGPTLLDHRRPWAR